MTDLQKNYHRFKVPTCFVEAKKIVHHYTNEDKYYGIKKNSDTLTDITNLNKELQTILNGKGANLDVDGIIGAKTLSEIKKYTINNGDKGELTKWVQKKLNSLGFNCGTPDGIAGDKTMSAIAEFQCKNSLGIGYLGGSDFDYLLT